MRYEGPEGLSHFLGENFHQHRLLHSLWGKNALEHVEHVLDLRRKQKHR